MTRRLHEKTISLLDAETGTIFKDHSNRLRFALAFPNIYRIGMSTLGMQIVYRTINDDPDSLAERVFLPDSADISEYQRTNTKLFTLESQTPVAEFDVFAFSVSFELDYIHILEMLSMSGVPLRSLDRDEGCPLVIAGGPAVTFNPEPMAEFFDAVIIGEAEDVVPEIIAVLKEHGRESRQALLEELACVSGVYVPSLYAVEYNEDGTILGISAAPPAPPKVERRRTQDLSTKNGFAVITTPNCEFPNMLLTETIRGCSRQCRFCVAGYASLPPRPRDVSGLEDGISRVGLVGSAVFDHPGALGICESLLDGGREFSVSSIRIETLTPELAEMMYKGGQRTMTIAPEAGSERLRRVINKPLTNEQIFEAVEKGLAGGFNRVKLYYMMGLPGEQDEDINDIAALARDLSSRYHKASFQLSVSCYVPKPWTPFEWCGMDSEKNLSRKLAYLKKQVSSIRKVQCSVESPRLAVVQALLARGDRKLSSFLEKAHELEGNYPKAVMESDIDTSFYVTRTRAEDETFPWDHIDMLVRKEYLLQELHKAFELKATSACKVGICQRCGVC